MPLSIDTIGATFQVGKDITASIYFSRKGNDGRYQLLIGRFEVNLTQQELLDFADAMAEFASAITPRYAATD